MSNIIPFKKKLPATVIRYEIPGYILAIEQKDNEYSIIENGKRIALYSNMLKALNYFYKHKEASSVVRG